MEKIAELAIRQYKAKREYLLPVTQTDLQRWKNAHSEMQMAGIELDKAIREYLKNNKGE